MGDLHKLSKPKPEPKPKGEPKLELVKDKRAGDRHLQDAAPVSTTLFRMPRRWPDEAFD
jgi:hypothetical protein